MSSPHDPESAMNFPPVTFEGMIAGAEISDTVSHHIGSTIGRQLNPDEKSAIFDMLTPGFSYFYELASKAGELAGSGDALGALSMLGSEENARDLIGDEDYESLIHEAVQQMISGPKETTAEE